MTNEEILGKIQTIAETDGRYKREAFLFVLVALEYTVSKLSERRHLTGQELARGMADFAREQYGFMAKVVLEKWGITATMDYGEIVYLLIDSGLLTKTETDSIEDFADVYDFNTEFDWNHLKPDSFSERF